MIYCISDLHGEYEKYISILEKINLSASDTLFVIGDICDGGDQPCSILLDMMNRPNVIPLAGNHDVIAAHLLPIFSQEIAGVSFNEIDDDELFLINEWFKDGGVSTMVDFRRRSAEEQKQILQYLREFRIYEEISVDGKDYVLVHGGLGKFSPDKKLSDYSPEEIIYGRMNYSKPLFEGNKYLVTGHTPTQTIPENPKPGYIYQANNHIAIDCGATFRGGQLGAICLDTGDEFYSE